MADSTEHAEARRLITEALGNDGDREYERRVLDLVFAATAAFGAGEADIAATMLNEHIGGAENPDLAAYHVCGAAALATGQLLDGDMVRAVAASDDAEVGSLLDLAVQVINSASIADETTMTTILGVVYSVSREDVHHLAATLIALRAEVVALDAQGGSDA